MGIEIESKKLYDVEELAQLLGVQEKTVRKLLRDGELKGKKLGKKWYVLGENLMLYFNDTESKE